MAKAATQAGPYTRSPGTNSQGHTVRGQILSAHAARCATGGKTEMRSRGERQGLGKRQIFALRYKQNVIREKDWKRNILPLFY